jgi:molybdopterin-guanine dinucleotide biosynthesis protein A
MKPLVAVLAGGKSSRMGTDKAEVTIGGESMLERVVGVAASVGHAVIVGRGGAGSWDTIDDLRPGRLGPLAGLESALVHAAGRDVVLVGVDQPFLRAETLVRLSELAGDVVIPIENGWEQVTCAVYRKPFLPMVREALDAEADLSILTILDRVDTTTVEPEDWRSWGEDGRSWFSIDTPEALQLGLSRYT